MLHLASLIFLTFFTTIHSELPLRLPNSVKPIRYNLTIEPQLDLHLDNPIFIGSVIIDIEVFEEVKSISLHAANLKISENDIELLRDDFIVKCNKIHQNLAADILTLEFPITLEKNIYSLHIKNFSANLLKCPKPQGFYIESYRNENGEERSFVITNFGAAGARKAFPCFDEPALKATFIINLIRPNGYNSISNGVQKFTQNLDNERFQDVYEETPKMSTYVLAFMITDLPYIQLENIRLFAQPSIIEHGELSFASKIAQQTLKALENFLKMNYTLSKMDIAVVSHQCFYSEAMENWGFVVFNDKHIVHFNSSDAAYIQTLYGHIAHEFSHQWFGNLVTMDWWSHWWLNEGVASFMQYYIPSLIEPQWQFMEQFSIEMFNVLRNDVEFVQPLSYKDASVEDLPNPWFTYKKSSIIIKMMQNFLTEDVFREGLHIYLQNNAFGTVTPKQFYNSFQQAVTDKQLNNLSVSSIMNTWENNIGFPLVTLLRNYETNSTVFKQKRFTNETDSQIWYIPLTFAQPIGLIGSPKSHIWLTESQQEIEIELFNNQSLIVNIEQFGYFRVNYDLKNWLLIIDKLQSDEYFYIPTINRAQLIDDSFTLAENGYIPYAIPLNLSLYLYREKDYAPWTVFFSKLDNFEYLLQKTIQFEKFQKYLINLLIPLYKHLTFDESTKDSQLDRLNRPKLLKWLCKYGHEECRQKSLHSIQQWRMKNITISPNLQPTVYCNGIRTDFTGTEWNFLFNQLNYVDQNCKEIILTSLGCSGNETILNNFLDLVIDSNGPFDNDIFGLVVGTFLTYNTSNIDFAIKYLRQHKEELDKRERFRLFATLTIYEFTTIEQYEKINNLIPHLYPGKSQLFEYSNDLFSWINKKYLTDILEWFTQLD